MSIPWPARRAPRRPAPAGSRRCRCRSRGGGGPNSFASPDAADGTFDARFSPGATITLNWTDVAGAAGYQLQIDSSDTFQAPFTREVTAAESLHAAWSSGRRFELRTDRRIVRACRVG
jgi:hypothetical protein